MPPFAFIALSDRGLRLPRRHLHLLKQLRRHRVPQTPRDRHRALAPVGHVGGGAEEGVGGGDSAVVLFSSSDEEEDVASSLGVLAVAPAGWGVFSRVALGLPVEEGR